MEVRRLNAVCLIVISYEEPRPPSPQHPLLTLHNQPLKYKKWRLVAALLICRSTSSQVCGCSTSIVCVCIYICVCVYINICIYIYDIYIHMYVYIYVYMCVYICMYARIYVYIYINMYIHMWYMHTYMWIYLHIYVYIHTYTHWGYSLLICII